MNKPHSVTATEAPLEIPTYPVGVPETLPMFFEKRVYQGSSGKVYPVPFIDKVFDDPKPVTYRSVCLENEFVRIVLLPEIGGRIFTGQDKTNNDYDFFYRQDVIKPALVGLAGPWISGGVEFNWPQHHRPGTFLPADYWIEKEEDGAQTVWMSEYDPISRLKGMHGIRLRPGSSVIELRGRLYNRTSFRHTFLWWANVAARVHDRYQSFFPEDVDYVADHAVRALSSFPVAKNAYYGVDYASRSGKNDLRWYRNIPVPTSYMICQTDYDFFGGYDFEADGGFIHVADRHIAPGKKQWTWGNDAFGWAWDRELTDPSVERGRYEPYIELMAGVYTDNQPDFTYLHPGEVKTFEQSWWPYQKLGPVQQASDRLAIRLQIGESGKIEAGVAASGILEGALIRLFEGDRLLEEKQVNPSPDRPWESSLNRTCPEDPAMLRMEVCDGTGKALLSYQPPSGNAKQKRDLAVEPPLPDAEESSDRLYLIGEHLDQYRHPTRYAESYWQSALKRDEGDLRANLRLGTQALARGQFKEAEVYLNTAIKRSTLLHPNPESGEGHYALGVLYRLTGRLTEAVSCLMKASWDYAWRSAAYTELAMIELSWNRAERALQMAESAQDTNRQGNRARMLSILALKALGKHDEADALVEQLLADDPMDAWALWEAGDRTIFAQRTRNDAQTILDIAFEYAACGHYESAKAVITWHHTNPVVPVAVPNPMERNRMTTYVLAWLQSRDNRDEEAKETLAQLPESAPDYFFPSRVEEQFVLEWAREAETRGHAAYGLGNYFYDRKRKEAAIEMWETAIGKSPDLMVAHRNLGIAYWNVRRDKNEARKSYLKALELAPENPRLVAEYSQFCGKVGDSVESRLAFLSERFSLVSERDDACVEWVTLMNDSDCAEAALDFLKKRRFHPWEGGEGKVLKQYTRSCLMLGQASLQAGDARTAANHFESAFKPPSNLGEAYHLHQAKSEVNYWMGMACRAMGEAASAVQYFEKAASEAGDFQQMAVMAHTELSYFRGLAMLELGRKESARTLFEELRRFALDMSSGPANIDYFATSLPNLLVLEDDLEQSKIERSAELQTLAEKGLGLLEATV